MLTLFHLFLRASSSVTASALHGEERMGAKLASSKRDLSTIIAGGMMTINATVMALVYKPGFCSAGRNGLNQDVTQRNRKDFLF